MTTTDGSRSISSYIACLMASRKVTWLGASPLPPAFVAGAMEAFAMGYLRPFFTAAFAAGFFADLAEGLADGLVTDFAATFATGLAATFARAFAAGFALVAPASLPAFFFPPFAPFFDFDAVFAAAALRDGLITSSGVSGESFSSTSFRSSLCAVSPK